MEEVARWAAFVLGLAIVIGTGGSLIRTLVAPRSLTSRLSVLVARSVVRRFFLFVADRFSTYEVKDRILALSAPVSLIVLLERPADRHPDNPSADETPKAGRFGVACMTSR